MTIRTEDIHDLDFCDIATGEKLRPVHPGEILREEFLVPLKLTPHALSLALQVPAPRINDIVRERRAITVDTALRLARFFRHPRGVLDRVANRLRHGNCTRQLRRCVKPDTTLRTGSVIIRFLRFTQISLPRNFQSTDTPGSPRLPCTPYQSSDYWLLGW